MKAGVLVFPGSNCDHDCYHVLKHVIGAETRFIWHKDADAALTDLDVIISPGGFSYGDYLRCGAIAKFSPVMDKVVDFAENGGLVVGICNGFQVLTEAGLLPGALMRNRSLRFICEYSHLLVENDDTPFTLMYPHHEVVRIPIAHADGNYFVDEATLKEMQAHGQIVFRYCDADGRVDDASNPNGSTANIAGVTNRRGNVLGMMPHPERCAEDIMETADGLYLFASIKKFIEESA